MDMDNKTLIKKTAKRKQEVLLPANADKINVPNRVVFAKYKFTLIEEKILNFVLLALQEPIRLGMSGENYNHLELFKESDYSDVSVQILLRNIGNSNQYKEIRTAALNLAKTEIKFPHYNRERKRNEVITKFLFGGGVANTLEGDRDPYLRVMIPRDVAKLLVEVELNKDNIPFNYTTFQIQIATNAQNKYTSRIFKLISSWKSKSGFYMSLEDFREWLCIEDIYPDYFDIKKNILLPVQKELEGKAPYWFNCKEKEFEKRAGKKVIGLQWKIVTPEFEEAIQIKAENFRHMLRMHVNFKDDDIRQLEPILRGKFDLGTLTLRFMEIRDYIASNRGKIDDPKAYLITSLLKEFAC